MTEETPPPKIVSIFNKAPFTPPPAPTEGPKVDKETVDLLKELLAKAKKGEIDGLAVLVRTKDPNPWGCRDFMQIVTVSLQYDPATLLGQLEAMKIGLSTSIANYAEIEDEEMVVLDDDEPEPTG